MMSYQVRFWSIKTVKNRRRPYGVRWIVGGQEKSEWFVTKTLAEHFHSELVQAARCGEGFDTVTGLPESKLRTHKSGSWYDHARAFAARNWPGSAAKTRVTVADCLASASRGLVVDERGTPGAETLHRALATWAFNRQRMEKQEPPDEIAGALAWLTKKSVPLADLEDPASGTPSTEWPSTWTGTQRRRSQSRGASRCSAPAWTTPLNSKSFRQIRSAASGGRFPRRRNRSILDRFPTLTRLGRCSLPFRSSPHLYAFFACLYFAGLRPSEAVALRLDDGELPATGWGRLLLAGSRPASGKQWTDDGRYHQPRSLKARPDGVKRPVPACPELVVILRAHVAEFGPAEDGRLFRSQRGNRLAPVSYESVWRRAREHVLTAAQLATPLAQRPYDLRHACLPLWLNGGVPTANVAARAGHSVAMLQSTYAH